MSNLTETIPTFTGALSRHYLAVHQPAQVRPDGAQVSTVGQPPVEGPRDDLALHGVADCLDTDAGRAVGHVLVDAEALGGALRAGAGAAQLHPDLGGEGRVGVHQFVAFYYEKNKN